MMPVINELPPLLHGGDIQTASQKTGIPFNDWIDLSTGISPYSYPTHSIPDTAFSSLPYMDKAFTEHAKQYYGSEYFVALPGTQVAIQSMPSVLEKLPILLPSVGYQEHRQAWQKAGNPLDYYNALDERQAFEEIELKLTEQPLQHLLIIHPNNPTTLVFTPQQLIRWSEKLAEGAYLIVDEAFIDTSASQSVIPFMSNFLNGKTAHNIIVLRSFGKFFGLAGVRLGFVFAAETLLRKFEERIPLWSINGPALYLANKAFSNERWQHEHQQKLVKSEQLVRELFKDLQSELCCHHRLFSSYMLSRELALTIFNHFYNKGILLRLIETEGQQSILRVGRIQVEDTSAQKRISAALKSINT